jgi:hypothetical protein
VIINNIVRPYKKFEIKIQKNEKALPTAMLGCRQITIFADSLTVLLSAKVMASDAVGTLRFFADRLALSTVRLSTKMSFADRFFYRLLATVVLSAKNSLPKVDKGCRQRHSSPTAHIMVVG